MVPTARPGLPPVLHGLPPVPAADYICRRPIYSAEVLPTQWAHSSVNRVHNPPPMLGIVHEFLDAFRLGLRSFETWEDSRRGTHEDPEGWRKKVRIDLRFLLFKRG